MITRISQVEITSRCNLRCKYCPHPTMAREKQDMSDEVFERTLYWLGEFQRQGTQGNINLHHFGESTLHPKFIEWVDRITDVVPEARVSSNGVGVTREMIFAMKDAGLTALSLSIHRPEVVQKVADWCIEADLTYDWASGMLSAPHNWAGQVEGRVSEWAKSYECKFLEIGECVILADGRLATCCIDAEGIVDLGTVWDDLRNIRLEPFSLCKSCHHIVPEGMFPGWREKLERIEVLA